MAKKRLRFPGLRETERHASLEKHNISELASAMGCCLFMLLDVLEELPMTAEQGEVVAYAGTRHAYLMSLVQQRDAAGRGQMVNRPKYGLAGKGPQA